METSNAAKFPTPRHNCDTLGGEFARRVAGKEGAMTGSAVCCRYEPSLDDLLDDDIMAPVLRSAGFDLQRFRAMIAETARRIATRRPDRSAGEVEEKVGHR
jgi:hypothetical protein